MVSISANSVNIILDYRLNINISFNIPDLTSNSDNEQVR